MGSEDSNGQRVRLVGLRSLVAVFVASFDPYQELFQGVIACIHSDFRIGGLKPGETKSIRGKIYIVPADVDALVKRYDNEFPRLAGSNGPRVLSRAPEHARADTGGGRD